MKQYKTGDLRNVALLSHGGDGKTTLAEAMLYISKTTDRFGKVSDGTAVCDYDPEETKRKISISTAIAPLEWNGAKVNIIDTPGYFDFAGEVKSALRVADAAIIVCSGKNGVEVGTEKSWAYAKERGLPVMIYISKLDEENADFFKIVEQLREKFGISICPIVLPITEGEKVTGYVELIGGVAKKYDNGVAVEMPIPDSIRPQLDPIKKMIDESVAETSEELMNKYFDGIPFTKDEIMKAFRGGIANGEITPVLCGSAMKLAGVDDLLDIIVDFFPAPNEREGLAVKVDEAEPLSAIVFKTVADPFVGKMSFFKVGSGIMKAESTVVNARTGQQEKIGKVYYIRGKKQIETPSITAGDLGVVTKLSSVKTGDTLCAPGHIVELEGIEFPKPCLSLAVIPQSKGDEEKISSGLARLMEEDPTFRLETNRETHQQIISGLGDVQLDVIISKLKNKFGVAVDLVEPKVPYRETIKKKVKVEGKHKKQSGGHGQFGHVWIEFEPGDSEEMVFEEKVFGGAVPKNFFPAVEKGLRDCVNKGVLAGYPVVNLKATLVDGSYHPVDSSEMSFKVAASLAFKAGLTQANPVLLEPIGTLRVVIPEEMMGDIIGDINKRRGRILGMNSVENGNEEVTAEVPMAEMHKYAIDLRSMSQGRGSFELTFERYEEAPPNVAQKVIEAAKSEA